MQILSAQAVVVSCNGEHTVKCDVSFIFSFFSRVCSLARSRPDSSRGCCLRLVIERHLTSYESSLSKAGHTMSGSVDSRISSLESPSFVVIGGGVAGLTCAIELERLSPHSEVTIVSSASVVKAVRGVEQITPLLGVVDVQERSVDDFTVDYPGLSLVRDEVVSVDAARGEAKLSKGGVLRFTRCCVATGASPSLAAIHPRVIGIRDTESVKNLSKRMMNARRVLIVGNGGIALELVHALLSTQACQVAWSIRDSYIGNTFFDPSASEFFLASLSICHRPQKAPPTPNSSAAAPASSDFSSQLHGKENELYQVPDSDPVPSNEPSLIKPRPTCNSATSGKGENIGDQNTSHVTSNTLIAGYNVGGGRSPASYGAGAGPDWLTILKGKGLPIDSGVGVKSSPEINGGKESMLDIQFGTELENIRDCIPSAEGNGQNLSWPLMATLTNGVEIGCDFVVSATGVEPNTGVLGPDFQRGPDGGLLVDEMMRVVHSSDSRIEAGKAAKESQDTIYAAGDCCSLQWPKEESAHWFQLRLWGQARAMGLYTAKCMADAVDELGSRGAFDLFVHATQFFGYKVALLGHFNGQGLGSSIRDFVSKKLVVNHDRSIEASGLKGATGDEGAQEDMESSDLKVLVRSTPGLEYIKVILQRGRVRGAMLIGDTGLEETFENLILNGTDVSAIGDDLLSVDVDLEDYFD